MDTQEEIFCRECDVKLVRKDFALKEVKRIAGNYYCWKCAAKILGEQEKPKPLDPKIQLPAKPKPVRGRRRFGRRPLGRALARPALVGPGGGGEEPAAAPVPRRFGGRRGRVLVRPARRTLGSGLPRYQDEPEEGVAPVRPRPQIRRGPVRLGGGAPGRSFGARRSGARAAIRRPVVGKRAAAIPEDGDGAAAEEGGADGEGAAAAPPKDNKMLYIGIGAGALVLIAALVLFLTSGKKDKTGGAGYAAGHGPGSKGPIRNSNGTFGDIGENYRVAAGLARAYQSNRSQQAWINFHQAMKNCNNAEMEKIHSEFPNLKPP